MEEALGSTWESSHCTVINSLHIHSKKEEGEPTYTPSSFNYPKPNHHEKEIIFHVFHDAVAPDTFFLGM